MIHPVLKFLAEQLNNYIDQVKKPGDGIELPFVILQNISRLDEEALKTTNKVLLTLVNLSEETTLKNSAHTIIKNDVVEYNNPPVNLNLFLMFSVCMANYEHAMIYLTHTITFFQGKHSFTLQNSITAGDGLPDDFHIILDLYSLTFEQANYVWSTLGGKQHPFVLYKARLLKMERKSTTEIRGVIKQVKIDGLDNT